MILNSWIKKLLSGSLLLLILTLATTEAFSEVIELSPSQDTFVNSKRARNSYGANKYIILSQSRRGVRDGLIKFDISEIPKGAEIRSAELLVHATYRRNYRNILTVYEVLDGWDESTTWSTRPDRASLSDDSVRISRRGYYKLDVTSLVSDWAQGAVTNNGFYLVIDKGHLYINSSENRDRQPILKIDYKVVNPPPEPVAEPEPEPVPDQSIQDGPGGTGALIQNTGVSDAPLIPVDKRILVVSKDGSGQYSNISDAIDDSRPGDTIQVKDGTYVERVDMYVSGTKELPIALINYPGHSPIIDAGGGEYPLECCPPGGTPRVEINAEWLIIQGFEIRYGWEGIKVYRDHNTIRGNWIHHNKFSGILVVSANDVFISNNTVEQNGTEPGSCTGSSGVRSPKNCHGVYFSEFHCNGMSNNTLRGNTISNHGGRGIQWNASSCGSSGVIRNTLVENNIIENNSWGMVMFYNTEDSLIINNTIVIEDYPETNDNDHTFVGIYGSPNNIFMNNIFQSSRSDVNPLMIIDSTAAQNTFNYNLWNATGEWWLWAGNWNSNFYNNYQSLSGWDNNGKMDTDPAFFDLGGGDYHINVNSKAINGGINSYCAQTDIDNEPRNANSEDVCDIGADERF